MLDKVEDMLSTKAFLINISEVLRILFDVFFRHRSCYEAVDLRHDDKFFAREVVLFDCLAKDYFR